MDEPTQAWVEARYGRFAVPDGNDLIGDSLREYGEWAQVELDLLAHFIRPGQTVLDIGAFIGTHARAFSVMVGETGKVCAFEPNEAAYRLLALNAQQAPLRNIDTRKFGLGREKALLSVRPMQGNGGGSSLEAAGGDAGIDVWPLDDVPLDGPVHFLKLDVEGMELDVLAGAERVIRRHSPILFLEVNSLEKSGAALAWARVHGYASFGVMTPAFNPANLRQSENNHFGNGQECGLLLLPQAQLPTYQSVLDACGLPRIDTLDALALLLLHKPQYPTEILPQGLGDLASLDYPSPRAERLAQALEGQARKIHDLEALLAEERSRAEAEHAAKAYAETLALERLAQLEAMDTQLSAVLAAKGLAESFVTAHEASIQQLNDEMALARTAAGAAQASITGLDAHVASLTARVASLEALLRVQESALAALREELASIRARRSYKLLAAAGLLPKAGDAT
ncbi:FkbM family methyltransferase [Achromobacter sp. GG226]|uniref:FkbM family methyltransferase n=1 Tax=Verticiella alkaliphila TaxID=2779529 RepID=UPI001C0E3651|nr:FkbM family methyltransferase [Verticiella sp. GG226]MBU4609194.1 FkbM family methyltransferase [Verticiella sp. GG226]